MDQNTNQPKRGLRADDGMPPRVSLQEANRSLVRPSLDPLEVQRATQVLQRAASAATLVPAFPEARVAAAPAPAPAANAEQPQAASAVTPPPLPPAWGSGANVEQSQE